MDSDQFAAYSDPISPRFLIISPTVPICLWARFFGIGNGGWSTFPGLLSSGPAHPFAGKLDAVCVVNEPGQDGVGMGRIANDIVPSVGGTLGGDHRGAASVAFFEDFQKIMTGGGVEGFFDAMLKGRMMMPGERCQGRRKSPPPRSIALTICR